MKILVFDDSQVNRDAAIAQLKDYDLTVVGTYDEAQKLLTPQFDSKKFETALKLEFGDFDPYYSKDERKKARYLAAEKVAKENATAYPDFDVVLTDLLVPASNQMLRPDNKFIGQEMPLGIFIGLLAAVIGRAKYVAVFTDSGHHDHPASGCIDKFYDDDRMPFPIPFQVEESKFILCSNHMWVNRFDPKDLSMPLFGKDYDGCPNYVHAKNWAGLLKFLTA